MAKKRRVAKRKAFRKAPKKATRRKSSKKQMLPLSFEEHAYTGVAGAVIGPLSEYTKPLQQQYLGRFGTYSDEAMVGLIGWAGHKWGGKLSPMVKKASKELYRGAVFSTGQQTGSGFVRGLFNKFDGRTGGNAQASGTRTLR